MLVDEERRARQVVRRAFSSTLKANTSDIRSKPIYHESRCAPIAFGSSKAGWSRLNHWLQAELQLVIWDEGATKREQEIPADARNASMLPPVERMKPFEYSYRGRTAK
jgi:hypothetical protein